MVCGKGRGRCYNHGLWAALVRGWAALVRGGAGATTMVCGKGRGRCGFKDFMYAAVLSSLIR